MNHYFKFLLFLISLNKCFGELYSVRYNIMKSTIENLLNLGTSQSQFFESFSIFADGTNSFTEEDKTIFLDWIQDVEKNIIQNDAVTPAQTKLAKLATELDLLFVKNPVIQKSIQHKDIPKWGPVANFQYITDEQNIDYFWELAATPGKSGCKIHDILLELTKDNPAVQKRIYTKNVPCSVSFEMVSQMANIIHDIPVKHQTYLKTLILPNGITFNQFIRIALAYYPTFEVTCDRILAITANAQYCDIRDALKKPMFQLFTKFEAEFSPDKTSSDCIMIASESILPYLDALSAYYEAFVKTTWEVPFGSFYEIIIFNECQIALLKSKAPNFYL